MAFNFQSKVLKSEKTVLGKQIEEKRLEFLQSTQLLCISDFGAGFGGHSKKEVQKTLAQITQSSARSRKEGELLYRITREYCPKKCLEMGTNIGFSSLYQVGGNPDSKFFCLEGAPELIKIAAKLQKQFGFNCRLIEGEFDKSLETLLKEDQKWDYVFLDGNHTFEASVKYFEFLLPRLNEKSLFILDDIYWSPGMKNAWNHIRSHPSVSTSIDLFYFGICFVNFRKEKEHFYMKF